MVYQHRLRKSICLKGFPEHRLHRSSSGSFQSKYPQSIATVVIHQGQGLTRSFPAGIGTLEVHLPQLIGRARSKRCRAGRCRSSFLTSPRRWRIGGRGIMEGPAGGTSVPESSTFGWCLFWGSLRGQVRCPHYLAMRRSSGLATHVDHKLGDSALLPLPEPTTAAQHQSMLAWMNKHVFTEIAALLHKSFRLSACLRWARVPA